MRKYENKKKLSEYRIDEVLDILYFKETGRKSTLNKKIKNYNWDVTNYEKFMDLLKYN